MDFFFCKSHVEPFLIQCFEKSIEQNLRPKFFTKRCIENFPIQWWFRAGVDARDKLRGRNIFLAVS
jgi:hypothetical protein